MLGSTVSHDAFRSVVRRDNFDDAEDVVDKGEDIVGNDSVEVLLLDDADNRIDPRHRLVVVLEQSMDGLGGFEL